MTQQPYDANDVLMGGGGPPAWKFEEPGTTRRGTIASPPAARQERDYDPNNPGGGDLKVFPSGDPIMGVHVEVQTDQRDPGVQDDDGRRTFYIEGRYIKEAVRNAVKATGARGLEVGGVLSVTFTHRDDPMDKRSRKYWQVTYTPAGNAALMSTPPTAPAQRPGVEGEAKIFGNPPPAPTGGFVNTLQGTTAGTQPAAATPPGMTPEQMAAFTAWQASQQPA